MKKIFYSLLLFAIPLLSNAQRHELDWRRESRSTVLLQPKSSQEPWTRGDSLTHVIKDTGGLPCATIIIKIVDDKVDNLKFNGTILGKKIRILPKEYCVYLMDDGDHEQYLKIISPSYITKEISTENDSIPRFIGGRKYTLFVWAKPDETHVVDYNPDFKLYAGIGLNPTLMLAPAISFGADWKHINVWLSMSHGLRTKDLSVYNASNEQIGTHTYHYLRAELHAGYEWEPWEHKAPLFSIMPQVGFSFDNIYSRTKDVNGNGFSASYFLAGARFALKTNNRHWCFFVTPECNIKIGATPKINYDEITSNVKSLKQNFDIQMGLLYYF